MADTVVVMHRADLVMVVMREGRGGRRREQRKRRDGKGGEESGFHGVFLVDDAWVSIVSPRVPPQQLTNAGLRPEHFLAGRRKRIAAIRNGPRRSVP